MLAATSKFLRQIIPPVIATLIAALLIAGFNRAFSTHLSQPRLGGLNAQNTEAPDERAMPRPAAVRPSWAAAPIEEAAPVREWQKGGVREAAKDPTGTRTAETAPAAAPTTVTRKEARPAEARQIETRQVEARPVESRQPEPRHSHVVAAPVMAPPPPVVTAPPVVVHAPPPVVMAPPVVVAGPVVTAPPVRQDIPRQEMVSAEPPMVTVPDRARPQQPAQPPQYAEAPAPVPPPQGPIGTIANTLNPATWFARARELGEKIEAVGNEILPSIRQ